MRTVRNPTGSTWRRAPRAMVVEGVARVRVEQQTHEVGSLHHQDYHRVTSRFLDSFALEESRLGEQPSEVDSWMGEPVPTLTPAQRSKAAALLAAQVRAAVDPGPMQVFAFIWGLRALEDQGASDAEVEAIRSPLSQFL